MTFGKRFIFYFSALFLLSNCGQIQFPDGKLDSNKEVTQDLSHYELKFMEIMDFEEGKYIEYAITGTVPAPGKAIIAVEGLPKGPSFNTDSPHIGWLPEKVNATGTGVTYERFNVVITLVSSLNADVILRKPAVLIVKRTL